MARGVFASTETSLSRFFGEEEVKGVDSGGEIWGRSNIAGKRKWTQLKKGQWVDLVYPNSHDGIVSYIY